MSALSPSSVFPLETRFLEGIDERRRSAAATLTPERQAALSQYFTSAVVASYMASLIGACPVRVLLLDAGSGIGILFAAAVEELCRRADRPKEIHIIAYEIDAVLANLSRQTLAECMEYARLYNVKVSGEIRNTDFLSDIFRFSSSNLFSEEPLRPNISVINPPYRKIAVDSPERLALRALEIETTNLYTGFLYAVIRLLSPEGQLVAITPRSFCNGSYFRSFREDLLCQTKITHLHLFKDRTDAFREDTVLQETLILRATKDLGLPEAVSIAHLKMPPDPKSATDVPFSKIVHSGDPEKFLRIPSEDEKGEELPFSTTLAELGIQASTGRVVDFRAAAYLRPDPSEETMPLLYPMHCPDGDIQWPVPGGRKPNALLAVPETASLSVPNGNYVLVKRFSAKEQPRRILVSLYESSWFPEADRFGLGLENHLNYFHQNGAGLDLLLARGLALYLSASCVDAYFRRFSGHTQVNATDLRNLRYPTLSQLTALGARLKASWPDYETIDRWVSKVTA